MPPIKSYHRPTSVAEALQLLARRGVNTAVLAGGTYLTAHLDELVDEIVDLQAAGLDQVRSEPGRLTLGAMVRLQTIVDEAQAPALVREAAHREGPNTLRNAATVGGLVIGADPESELLAALLVFEATVEVHPTAAGGPRTLPLPEFLADVPAALGGGLVTAVSLRTGGRAASERVARTPADRPIVAAVARLDEAGQVRLALCGVAPTPVLVEPDRLEASLHPPGDFRGSGEYRRQMAIALTRRAVERLR